MEFLPINETDEDIGRIIVHSAYTVHRSIGPGLLEKVYEVCLTHELKKNGLDVERQVDLPIYYDGIKFDEGLRLDLLVNELVIVELKAVDQMNPVFDAQLISYLRMTGLRLGYLINFNVPIIKEGIKRFVL